MALSLLRSSCGLPTMRRGHILLKQCDRTRLCLPAPPRVSAAVRPFSSDRGNVQKKPGVVVRIPNPVVWFRTKIKCFLIKTYFDKEFSIEEFTEGATQAFSHVSRLMSQCQFEAMEGLVAKEMIEKLKTKCNLLPLSHKEALCAHPDDIVHTTPVNVGMYLADNERNFVTILVQFMYLTNARLPGDIFQFSSETGEAEGGRLLSAYYLFQRELTKGVAPDWTIKRIQHRLLD